MDTMMDDIDFKSQFSTESISLIDSSCSKSLPEVKSNTGFLNRSKPSAVNGRKRLGVLVTCDDTIGLMLAATREQVGSLEVFPTDGNSALMTHVNCGADDTRYELEFAQRKATVQQPQLDLVEAELFYTIAEACLRIIA